MYPGRGYYNSFQYAFFCHPPLYELQLHSVISGKPKVTKSKEAQKMFK